MDESLEAAKERRWREVAAVESAYERGELDDAGWHAAMADLIVPAYLAAGTPEGGSGSSRDSAGRRLPEWADRIWIANVIDWVAPRRFHVVRTGPGYVPRPRRRELVEHLLAHAGRVVIGVFNEESDRRTVEHDVASWGLRVTGRTERERPDPRIRYRAFWVDAPR